MTFFAYKFENKHEFFDHELFSIMKFFSYINFDHEFFFEHNSMNKIFYIKFYEFLFRPLKH